MTSPTFLASQPIDDFLAHVALAPRQAHKALSLWPLVRRPGAAAARAPAYALLGDALADGAVLVDEVSEAGSVPNVRVANRGKQAVLVPFGETLRGAKQDRVANASFLVAAKSELTIDVSCVEQGRWGRRPGARFGASAGLVSNALRRKMERKVHESLASGRRFGADQYEVWLEVKERVARSRAASQTSAYEDYAATRRRDVEEVCASFAAVPGQVGFVAALGNEVTGLEAIGRPEVFARAFLGLVRGYAIDAVDAGLVAELDGPRAPRRARFDSPEAFLLALAAAPATSGASRGLGVDLRVAAAGLAACALAWEGDVVHLTAFPQERA